MSKTRIHNTVCTAALTCLCACASTAERTTRRELQQVDAQLAPLLEQEQSTERTDPLTIDLDGSLGKYVEYAYAYSPELRATFEEWRAATERPRQRRRLPEPTITYAGFIRSVETRVGPQNHRLGAMQWFPWPTTLTAGGRAEALAAQSAQRRFEAHAVEISAQVSRAYWDLWIVQRNREVQRAQKIVLGTVSEQIRIRVEASLADLSDLAQVNLQLAMLDDAVVGLDEQERRASAELVRAIGAPFGTSTPVRSATPAVGLPAESTSTLLAAATAHPRVESMELMADANEQHVRRARAERFPSLGVGVDWIITGDAADPTISDSGKDAVIAMASIRLPLWQGAYGAAEREAKAKRRAYQARQIAARNRAASELERSLARVRNHDRRVELYRTTLVPQAETTFESVQNSYQSGRATVGELLMAERQLLDLQLELFRAQADHARSWAELERVVGRRVAAGGDRDDG